MENEKQSESHAVRPRRGRRHRAIVASLSWVYLVAMIAVWLFLRLEGNRWWVGMVAMYAPRWVCIIPLILLIPMALAFSRRSLWILAVGSAVTVFPVMGLCLPWGRLSPADKSVPSIRLLTCNVHHQALDASKFAEVIASLRPDIVVLQEWTPQDRSSVFGTSGWNVVVTGETCVASRFRIYGVRDLPRASAVHAAIETPMGVIDIFNVHFASPHFALRDSVQGLPNGPGDLEKNNEDRANEAGDLNQIVGKIHGPLLIAGDFNLPSDSAIFRDNFSSLTDSFPSAGFGFGWTYHNKWTTTRIDHILCNDLWTCRRCWVGPNVGSPHRPLIADIAFRREW